MAKKRKIKNPMSWEPPHILAARLRRIADDLEKPGPHRYWHRFKLEITNELESDIRDTLAVIYGAEEASQYITAMNCATLEEENNEQAKAFEAALEQTNERHGQALKKLADKENCVLQAIKDSEEEIKRLEKLRKVDPKTLQQPFDI